jgi:hypothetical protein
MLAMKIESGRIVSSSVRFGIRNVESSGATNSVLKLTPETFFCSINERRGANSGTCVGDGSEFRVPLTHTHTHTTLSTLLERPPAEQQVIAEASGSRE